MEFNSLQPKYTQNDSVLLIEGSMTLADADVMFAANCSGRATGTAFSDQIKTLLLDRLKDLKHVPLMFEVIALHIHNDPHTELKSWTFSLVAVSRFAGV